MHSNLQTGDHVMIHPPTGGNTPPTRALVTYVGELYFVASMTRFRKSTGIPIDVYGAPSVATPDTGETE